MTQAEIDLAIRQAAKELEAINEYEAKLIKTKEALEKQLARINKELARINES
jgi:hypothetical protein